MNFSLPFSKLWLVVGVGLTGILYLLQEYRCKRAEERMMECELAQLTSPDVETQKVAIESVLELVAKNKRLQSRLCKNHIEGNNNSNLLNLKRLISCTPDCDSQYAAIELVALLSEEEKNLGKIREAGLFQALVSVLSSPVALSDDIVEGILVVIRNCTKPTLRIIQHPVTGQLVSMTADQIPRDRNDDVYDRDDEWFSKELYQLHGLEPVITKLLSDTETIQNLALEIITNYCKIWKNKEEVGELGGVGIISRMLGAFSSLELQSLALDALRHCIYECECNADQLRKAKPIAGILSFLQAVPSGTGKAAIINAVYLLYKVVDKEGAVQIRKEGFLPQLLEYLDARDDELEQITASLLKQMMQFDSNCKQEFLRLRPGGGGNPGITPRRTTA